MTFDEMIFEELQNADLNGVIILNVVTEADVRRVAFEVPPEIVEFVVDADYKFQVLSVKHLGVTYEEPSYLAKFDDFVFDVMMKIKLVELKLHAKYEKMLEVQGNAVLDRKEADQARLEDLMIREERIRRQEEELDLREREVRRLEQVIYSKEDAVALQRQEEELELEAKRLENRQNLENMMKSNTSSLLQLFKKSKK